MVFVNINYRVGPFGFLSSEKVREDGDLNVGLLDQRQALEWVQEHITIVGFILTCLCFQSLTFILLVRRRPESSRDCWRQRWSGKRSLASTSLQWSTYKPVRRRIWRLTLLPYPDACFRTRVAV